MLLLDASVPAPIKDALRHLQVDVEHADDHIRPGGHADEEIVALAKRLNAIVVAVDLDFTTRKQLFLDMAAQGITVAVLRGGSGPPMDVLAEMILYYRDFFYSQHDLEPSVISVKRPSARARALRTIQFDKIKD